MAKVIYIGLRMNGDKLDQAFKYRSKTLCFSGIKWCQIGHVYEYDEKGKTMKVRPESLGVHPIADEEQIEKWELEEVAARNMDANIKASKARDRLDLFNMSVSRIADKVGKMPYATREAVADRVRTMILMGRKI